MLETIRNGDYAYIDFVLLQADRNAVDDALQRKAGGTDALSQMPHPEPYRPGLFMRLLMRLMGVRTGPQGVVTFGKDVPADERARLEAAVTSTLLPGEDDAPGPAFTLHRGPAARLDHPIAFLTAPSRDPAGQEAYFADDFDDHRVSSLADAPGWVLIEYREMVSGGSMMAGSLSGESPDIDVLYFRFSGNAANEKQYDFHVNRNYAPVRRVLCHETWPAGPVGDPDPGQAWWEGIADGPPSCYEPEGIYDGATEATLLENARLEAILAHNGLSLDKLFGPGARQDAVLFSHRRGGEAIA